MSIAQSKTLHLNSDDNIVVALENLRIGDKVSPHEIELKTPVLKGHKLSIRQIDKGENVIRYGQIIGSATEIIQSGCHVHSHNLDMSDHTQDYAYGTKVVPLEAPKSPRTFMGYPRANGRFGTRNYIGILTSVNCSGSVARFIAEAVEKSGVLDEYPNIDGVVPIVHSSGCGMASSGEGYDTLFRTLSGYAQNPNFGGVILIGLGCEVMQLPSLVGDLVKRKDGTFHYMTIQQTGGTRKSIESGITAIKNMATVVNEVERVEAPLSGLMLGMQCGGSDGYSGITANPALGVASDLLVKHGGTSILSETSEVYGAEHLLTRRALSAEIGEDLIELIHWWEAYCEKHDGSMDNNPSPGNKKGGLTTILEKSLGAVAKAGSAPLAGVFKFGEQISTQGLVFMDSPGYDPCSVTGQIASGANLIIFTTGRGSVSGFKPSPCIKLATNSDMFSRMEEDMDVNCGDIIEDGISLETKGEEIFEEIIAIASGKKSKSERLGFGGVEFVPWQLGAVM
ncbi:altronate dehydratase family protein [Lentilitoribacter sp. Alg239-R112]|uniref:UxaA family hydrolase n=1 Tax=Lentilitoribacter sp. Alg239-R112 TaxID=2305987 RepID=UPI0013A70AC7|nr:altronate dehydratase family protein [Lentilitoribacter sp. Alg239-R112]